MENIIGRCDKMQSIYFPRSCKPAKPDQSFEIVGFHDGADKGHGGVVYLRYSLVTGGYEVSLLGSKTRVGKLKNTPRDEMNGLLVLCRYISAVLEGMRSKPTAITLIGDSTCTILSTETDKKLKTWMSGKVDEVHRHLELWRSMEIEVDKLYYIPSDLNPADILTRGDVKSDQMQLNSIWQTGPDFLRQEKSTWPITRSFPGGEIPRAELLVKCYTIAGVTEDCTSLSRIEEMATRTLNLQKVLGALARLLRGAEYQNRRAIIEAPTSKYLDQANLLLQIIFGRYSVPDIMAGKCDILLPTFSKGRWVTRGRLGSNMTLMLGTDELVILDNKNQLSILYMWAAHKSTHSYPKITLARSRTYAWIRKGYSLAKRVVKSCAWCILQLKLRVEQRLGDVQFERLQVGLPPWTNVAIDLGAPITVEGVVNKRSSMKCWPLLICCMLTGAIHIELMTGYGADNFLLSWWIFCEIRGYPARVQSDSGSQLKASVPVVTWSDQEDPTCWDWKEVTTATARTGTEFKIVSPGCQWRNGLAESQIKAMKRSLHQLSSASLIRNLSPTLNYQEWVLLLHRVSNISNERPLGVKNMTEDIIQPLTPNQLLIGRTKGKVTCPDSLPENYSQQKTYSDTLLQTWWSHWYPQVFDNLIPYQSYRDSRRHTNLQPGDICLIRYDSKIKATFRYCRVLEVFDHDNNVLRNVRVRIGVRGSQVKPKEMMVGVQRLTLVTPNEKLEDEILRSIDDSGDKISVNKSSDVINDVPITNLSDDDEHDKSPQQTNKSREIRNLHVPNWMKPTNKARTRVNTVMNLSTYHGLKIGM